MTLAAALTNLIAYILLLSFFIFPLQGEEISTLEPLFIPPKEWIINPNTLPSSRVKISFFTKAKKHFCPSINLIEEQVSSSIEKYMKTIQKLYEVNGENCFRRLGTLKTKAGIAHLISLDTETPLGKARVLQSIFLKGGTAYILTGAVLQEDFGLYQKDLIDSFRSFSLEPDVYDYVKNDLKKNNLIDRIKNLSHANTKDPSKWEPFKSFITQEFKEEGPYWQFLILEQTQKKFSENQN